MKSLPIGGKLYRRNGERAFNILTCVVLALLIAVLSFNIIYKRVYVVGSSMEDTLYGAPDGNPQNVGGDFVYIFKATPERGDIAVIRIDDKTIIKRIIGVGGDRVKIVDGKLFLNGAEQAEPYVSQDNNTPQYNNFDEITVPENCYFFLGDNRNVSNDSRVYGCASADEVLGIVAEWSLTFKKCVTAVNTFFEFTLPAWLGAK